MFIMNWGDIGYIKGFESKCIENISIGEIVLSLEEIIGINVLGIFSSIRKTGNQYVF